MSRRKKSAEERLVELVREMGIDKIQFVLSCLALQEVAKGLDFAQNRPTVNSGATTRPSKLTKSQPTRQRIKPDLTSEIVTAVDVTKIGGQP